jgi:phage FluMu protein Com
MKEIKCSHCNKTLAVPSEWKYKECERCHARTGSRNDKRRQKAKKSIIQQLGNFDEAYEGHISLARKLKTKPMSKKAFFDKWLMSQKAKGEQITKTLRHFSSQSAPILGFVCLRFRDLLEQRNQNLDFQPETDEDFQLLYCHPSRCEACGNWCAMHKDGNLDVEPVEPEAKEGYCPKEEWKRNMDGFSEAVRGQRDPIDSMRDVDPNLVRSAFRDDKPSEPQQPRDPYLEELREKQRQQQQPQKPEGFLDRLRKPRDH